MHSPPQAGSGFSMVEVLVVLAVAGILLAAAAPSLMSLVHDNRIGTRINLLLADLHLARLEAIKRNQEVVVCRSSDGAQCSRSTDPRTDWSIGRIIYVNTDEDDKRDPGEPLLQVRPAAPETMRLHFNQWWRVVYRSDGGARNGTFTLCDFRGTEHGRALILYYTGRPRISDRRPGGEPLECD